MNYSYLEMNFLVRETFALVKTQRRQATPLRLLRAGVLAGVGRQRLEGEAAPGGARLPRPPLRPRGLPEAGRQARLRPLGQGARPPLTRLVPRCE